MKMMVLNCKRLGDPSTISQLKEPYRFFKLQLIFICEMKKKRGFVGTVAKKLGLGSRLWDVVEPCEKGGGMMEGW